MKWDALLESGLSEAAACKVLRTDVEFAGAGTQVQDITALAELQNLEELELGSTSVVDIMP